VSAAVDAVRAKSQEMIKETAEEIATADASSGDAGTAVAEVSITAIGSMSSIESVAARCGLTRERVQSLQVKARILISLVQVISALGVVFSIPYPPFYDDLVSILGVFSLDIFTIMPLGCMIDLNHDHYLLMRTAIPLGILAFSFVYRWHLLRRAEVKKANGKHKEAEADKLLADQLLTYNFILFYLLFPSTSANIFATFQCETLDDMAQSSVLRIDLSVDCNAASHYFYLVWAVLMVPVFPIGIPALYAYLLFHLHGTDMQLLRRLELKRVAILTNLEATSTLNSADKEFKEEKGGAERSVAKAFARTASRSRRPSSRPSGRGSGELAAIAEVLQLKKREEALRAGLPDYVQKLILGYELRTYYFEIIECFRKLAIVCLPVFFRPSGSVGQLIFGLLVCFLTFGAHMLYSPYIEDENDRLAQLCQVHIFFSLTSSIALKYDPTTLSDSTNMDALLSFLTFVPILFSVYFLLPDVPEEIKIFVKKRLDSVMARLGLNEPNTEVAVAAPAAAEGERDADSGKSCSI